MHHIKPLILATLMVFSLAALGFAHPHYGSRGALTARNVYQLSSDYVTDEICVPKVGMHYLDLTKPVYGNPQIGFDHNGTLLFIQYLFDSESFNQDVMNGLFTNLKMHRYKKAKRMKIKFGQAKPEWIPPQYVDIVCNEEKPDSNLCAPHYDVTIFLVDDDRLDRACEGATHPTPYPDPRRRRAMQDQE